MPRPSPAISRLMASFFERRTMLSIMAPDAKSGIAKPADVNGKRLAVKLGTTGDTESKRLFREARIVKFESEGASVSEWIRHRRLDRCQRDLANPALAHQTIVAIAGRWGLTNGPHFSRLFRSRYGCSPREYRARAAGL